MLLVTGAGFFSSWWRCLAALVASALDGCWLASVVWWHVCWLVACFYASFSAGTVALAGLDGLLFMFFLNSFWFFLINLWPEINMFHECVRTNQNLLQWMKSRLFQLCGSQGETQRKGVLLDF
uniref:Candidate secreted effector n=1 Tax=Meloidogyne incognita TaxID=6306 RepID=A0A914KI08_MELIC